MNVFTSIIFWTPPDRMRCRAFPGGTSTGRPAGDDNPQDRAVVQKSAVDVDPKMAGGFLSAIQKQIASIPILVSCLKNWFNHFLDELQRRLPTEVGMPGWGQGEPL
jgi:hypothetical protein